MLCVVDYLDALAWVEREGGVAGMIARCNANLALVEDFVSRHDWINFLATDKATRSNTSVCLSLDLPAEDVKALCKLLDKEKVAYDIGAYRDAPAGLRIWCGATVESSNIAALLPWLAWAYSQFKSH
jgi:phosphoserine aminotransferase